MKCPDGDEAFEFKTDKKQVIEWIDISVPAVSHQQGADELVFKSPCC
jgi:hypothetical protein